MGCVYDCSHFDWEPMSSCFNKCACSEEHKEERKPAEIETYAGISFCGLEHNYLPEPSWNHVHLDSFNRCHYESFYHDGSRLSWTCHSSHECGGASQDEEVVASYVGLREEIRVVASAVF